MARRYASLLEEMGKGPHSEVLPNPDAEVVFARAREGEPIACRVVEEFTRYLALALVSIVAVLDPEMIVLGGGVSESADVFRDRLVELCSPVLQVMPRVEVSRLGVDAGVMGAVALALHNTLAAHPRILILDQPTAGIDVGTKEEIYAFLHELAADGAALILISDDPEELARVCDRVLVMRKGRIVRELTGPSSLEILASVTAEY